MLASAAAEKRRRSVFNPPLPERFPQVSNDLLEEPYFLAKELGTVPVPTVDVFSSPSFLGDFDGAGSLVADIWVTKFGDVLYVDVQESNLPDGVLQQIREEFLATRFSPGVLDKQPVNSILRIEVEVQPINSAVSNREFLDTKRRGR